LEYLGTHSKDVAARTLLGQAYATAGQTNQAEDEFLTIIKDAPSNYVALAALGELYYRENQLEKAEPYLARAAKNEHEAPQIRIEWSLVLARLHRYKEAESALGGVPLPSDKAEQISFHRLKASIDLGLGHASAAAAEMEKALALKPEDPGLTIATAAAQLQDKHWERAAKLAEPVYSRSHDPAIGLVLLEAQLGMNGEIRQTLDALDDAALASEEAVDLRVRAAELLTRYGKFPEAVDQLKKAAALDENRPGLLCNLALAQLQAAQLDDALASAEKCKAAGDSAEIEDLLGDIQEARGDNLAAVKSYQAAIVLAPNEEKYRLSLALELLRHKSFEATKVVLQQADEAHPNSWRIQFALGMLEYFMGKEDEATPILQRAADLSPDPPIALKYAGDIQLDRASGPDPALISQLCKYADLHPKEATMQYYCGALLLRKDYVAENKSNMPDILRRLNNAAHRLPNDPGPHCHLERAYRWMDQWQSALQESEICVRLDPDSAQPHYRLAQIYQHLGQQERSKAEMKIYEAASQRVADENAQRDQTMKTFLYTIQKAAPDRN
jgi:tetratricopeptide (TPR) repeat protein